MFKIFVRQTILNSQTGEKASLHEYFQFICCTLGRFSVKYKKSILGTFYCKAVLILAIKIMPSLSILLLNLSLLARVSKRL